MKIVKNIVWSPKIYTEAAVVAEEAGKELLSRLGLMRQIAPLQILDMGCGPGEMSVLLKQQYPESQVIALDIADAMLRYANQQNAPLALLTADATSLPLKKHSIDLIFANLLLPWCDDIAGLLQEWRRVLKPDGVLMFTAFGLETAKEWAEFIPAEQLALRMDMHDYGDLLMHAGFADPVLDVNHYILSYKDQAALLQELRSSLIWFPNRSEMENVYQACHSAPLEFSYEVIFAHAFAPLEKKENDVVKIPFDQVRRQLLGK